MLLLMWYIGQVIENTSTDTERKECIQKLSEHHFKLAKKVYYLYELLGTNQIARTRQTTVTMIYKLKRQQYYTLVQQVLFITGA